MSHLFNASEYLLDRRLAAGDADRVALAGPAGELTYAALGDRVRRTAAGLRAIGVQPEQRIIMVMADSPHFVVVYLAALRIGAIPVPVSTMLRAGGIADLLRDSRARYLAVTGEFAAAAESAAAAATELAGVLAARPMPQGPVLSGAPRERGAGARNIPVYLLDDLAAHQPDDFVYDTTADSPAFWLYTSGTTGTPKGAMHRHGAVPVACETYGRQVLGIQPDDRCLSAAKAFFAYGLGNSVLFPLSAGAASVLLPPASRPGLIAETAAKYGATLFFGGPTFFANMLRAGLPPEALAGVRLAASAGEALPAALYERWTRQFGIDIIDGIGMTEMLHIFLSNRPGAVRPGTTGVAVPGYDLKLVDEDTGREVAGPGRPGTLFVRGASAATGYWARYDASRLVFQGEWLRTGDTYVRDGDGYYACLGRTGDMIKASGIWVSPMEVESQLLAHPAVAEAVVVGAPDADGLEKPVAYVILAPGATITEAQLIGHCREGLPSVKRPRAIVFTDAFPATATGKVRRVELRELAAGLLRPPVLPPTRVIESEGLMLDGFPLIDVHLHTASKPTLKLPWETWAQGFGDRDLVDRLYDDAGTVIPALFHEMLAAEGVDTGLLLCEYSPKVTGIQPVEDMLPIAAYDPARVKVVANVNPHLHYPIDDEVRRQLALGAVALKIHPVHAGAPANDRMLYPAYEAAQAAGVPVVVHCGTSTFPGASNAFADPVVLDDVLRDFRSLTLVLAHGGRGWWYDAAAFLALSSERVWIDLSGLPPTRLRDYYARQNWKRLTKRMIFGTDWPGIPGIAANARAVAKVMPDDDTTAAVLAGNARRVYNLKAGA